MGIKHNPPRNGWQTNRGSKCSWQKYSRIPSQTINPTKRPMLSGVKQKLSKYKPNQEKYTPFKLIDNYPEQKHIQTYENRTDE